jgi:hypothetical protein
MRSSSGRSSRFPELITEANVGRPVVRRIQMMHVLYRRPAAVRGIEGVDGESTPIHDVAMIVICLPNPPSALTPWSRWVNEQAVADYGKCATSVKIRWTKPERSGERLAVAPSRDDRCHGCAQKRGACDRRVRRIKGQAHHRRLPRCASEEDIDEIVCRFISKGKKNKAIFIDAVSPDRLVRRSG